MVAYKNGELEASLTAAGMAIDDKVEGVDCKKQRTILINTVGFPATLVWTCQ